MTEISENPTKKQKTTTHSHVDAFLKKFDEFDESIKIVSSQCKAKLELTKGSLEYEKAEEKITDNTIGNLVVFYPCGPGKGTPVKNIFFKNIAKLLDQQIKKN